MKSLRNQKGGDGQMGHTVMDSSFFGGKALVSSNVQPQASQTGDFARPPLNPTMNVLAGGKRKYKKRNNRKNQKGGDGQMGHTVMDSSFFSGKTAVSSTVQPQGSQTGDFARPPLNPTMSVLAGGKRKNKKSAKKSKKSVKKNQKGGDGQMGHTVMDSSFFSGKTAVSSTVQPQASQTGDFARPPLNPTMSVLAGGKRKNKKSAKKNTRKAQKSRTMKGGNEEQEVKGWLDWLRQQPKDVVARAKDAFESVKESLEPKPWWVKAGYATREEAEGIHRGPQA